ncbi:hypothetical protein SARC_03668 [Sphaeroforma arctica JP610]|uniref:Amine oxidase domain-containing protein n=1 Tax=Sphaeroforma arctica JP610 TaxID=667725 RepID=A0A0L0G7C1_9EUKA|nr:hypothetical protein SARC_03668 [Sphaeroforma arctica JP610]KNC84103.1 hypothetical protein SARC_03668 [Sphaeroforma arctica JP610]|eukprot:XP_014158005.1 hypothetical protein SARC_03668 [Sphaeroforma arctica JP610]
MLTGASQTKKETNAIAVKLAAYDADTQKLIDRLKGSAAWGLEGGMQTLVDAIRTQLNAMPNVEVRTDSECTSVVSSSSGVVVQVRNGPNSQTTGAPETLTVDHVMLTVSSLDASRLLTAPENATDTGCVRNATDPLVSGASSFGRLTRLLRSTPFTSVGVVNLVYDTDILKHKVRPRHYS